MMVVSEARTKVGHGVGFGPSVPHSVSRVTRGTRWSLVVFFDKRRDFELPGWYVDFQMTSPGEERKNAHI